jgi:hypothetical protein
MAAGLFLDTVGMLRCDSVSQNRTIDLHSPLPTAAPLEKPDRCGAVHILTDGSHLEISGFVPCPRPTVPASVQAHAPQN